MILGSIGTPPCSAHPAGADCIAADGGSHTIGDLRFVPDGTLFVGNGDGSDGDSPTASLRAQDLNSTNGKILRINKDGTAPTDNPFYDGTNSMRSKVWLYGVRNPFRFAIQPETGEICFGDVGWNTWEEVDHGVAGANFGWPCYEGNGPQPSFQTVRAVPAAAASVRDAAVLHLQPQRRHRRDRRPVLHGHGLPAAVPGQLLLRRLLGNFIKRVVFDASGEPARRAAVRDERRGPRVRWTGPGRDDLLPVVHDRRDPPHPVQRRRRRRRRRRRPTATRRCRSSFSSAGRATPAAGR